ncbi:MAG: peptidoglycan D,D-transpeptidase FtsI family protein [Ilumatobacteraceae bacterium]
MRRRARFAFLAFLLAFAWIMVNVVRVQVIDNDELRADGVAQRTDYRTIAAPRGTIFDRDGNEMAITVPATSIYADPRAVLDPTATAHVLSQMLGLDPVSEADLVTKLSDRSTSFVYVQRFVDSEVADAILSLRLAGVNGVSEPERVQVAGGLARNVIGRTDPFGTGAAGLELQYEKVLRGQDGTEVREINNSGRSLPGGTRTVDGARPGTDLVLTIDRSMQFQVEQALIQRVTEVGALGGNAIVLDTATGDILAISSVRLDETGVPVVSTGNMAAVEAHEPGSVAKIFSVAAAIDSGVATENSTYDVPGVFVFDEGTEFEYTIKDAYPHETEPMTLHQILVKSSNIGTMLASTPVGTEALHDYLADFGFGSPTNLDFPGESPGSLRAAAELRGSEKATITYGYGFAATSLQLAAAVNTVANGGMYVPPRLVMSTIDDRGIEWDAPLGEGRRVISEATADTMATMLTDVVCSGTGSRAAVPGISVAGKTGTGYKTQDNGTYVKDDGSRAYFATFAGFLPADQPRVTILVSIDEPNPQSRDRFGGTAAAPVFAAIARVAIQELSIEPTPGDTGCPAVA